MIEYRAKLKCSNLRDSGPRKGNCIYCNQEPHEFWPDGQTDIIGPKLFPTREAARAYGQGMASRVYGSHHVLVFEREVGEFTPAKEPGLYEVTALFTVETYALSQEEAIKQAGISISVDQLKASMNEAPQITARLVKPRDW